MPLISFSTSFSIYQDFSSYISGCAPWQIQDSTKNKQTNKWNRYWGKGVWGLGGGKQRGENGDKMRLFLRQQHDGCNMMKCADDTLLSCTFETCIFWVPMTPSISLIFKKCQSSAPIPICIRNTGAWSGYLDVLTSSQWSFALKVNNHCHVL